MGKKDNFNQAVFEMFGVGKDSSEQAEKASAVPAAAQEPIAMAHAASSVPSAEQKFDKTYRAAGTSIEGTIKAKGDVEIACDFKGEVISEGDVVLHSKVNGNITAANLSLIDTVLSGDVHVSGSLQINEGSVITGNIHAKSVVCSGKVNGDMDIKGDLLLGETAQIEGNINTKTMMMARGAVVKGNLSMSNP